MERHADPFDQAYILLGNRWLYRADRFRVLWRHGTKDRTAKQYCDAEWWLSGDGTDNQDAPLT